MFIGVIRDRPTGVSEPVNGHKGQVSSGDPPSFHSGAAQAVESVMSVHFCLCGSERCGHELSTNMEDFQIAFGCGVLEWRSRGVAWNRETPETMSFHRSFHEANEGSGDLTANLG